MSTNWLNRSGIKRDPDMQMDPSADATQSEGDEPTVEVKNDKATPIVGDERGIPSVNRSGFRSRALPLSLAAGVLAITGFVWLIPSPKVAVVPPKDDPKATANQRFDESKSSAVLTPATPPLPPEPPQSVSMAPAQPTPLKTPAEPIKVVPAPDPKAAPKSTTASAQRQLTPLELRQQSKSLIVGADEKAPAESANNGPVAVGAIGAVPTTATGSGASGLTGSSGAGSNGPRDQLGDSLRPTLVSGTSASRLADRTFMMTQGNLLDCSLDVAISSSVPGMTKCTLTRSVYGDDRKVVLLERGTELTGQFQGGLQQGQSRLFILWTRAKTPKGVLINLNSPGSDALGRSGVDGYVDNHFWQRFGAGLFLSVIDDSLQYLTAKAQSSGSGSGTTIVLPQNTTQTAKDAAAIAVENDVHIPPTLDKNQGEHVSVFVARDLDFRNVYAIKPIDLSK